MYRRLSRWMKRSELPPQSESPFPKEPAIRPSPPIARSTLAKRCSQILRLFRATRADRARPPGPVRLRYVFQRCHRVIRCGIERTKSHGIGAIGSGNLADKIRLCAQTRSRDPAICARWDRQHHRIVSAVSLTLCRGIGARRYDRNRRTAWSRRPADFRPRRHFAFWREDDARRDLRRSRIERLHRGE